MLNRQPLPPLYAAAGIAGPVLVRPTARTMAGAPRRDAILDATIVRPNPGTLEDRTGSGSGRAAGSGRPADGPPGGPFDGSGEPQGRPDGSPHGEADDATDAATADGADGPTELDAADLTIDEAGIPLAVPADAGAVVAAAPDLSGYGAYGKVPSAGSGLSRDELVQRYAHLVKYVVGRLGVSVPGLFDHEDAMQAGVLGLLRAIDAYKPEAAASFESYAILRIRGSILDAVRSLDTVGRAGREAARAIQGAIRDLQHELGRSPTEAEIAGRLNMTLPRYRERLQSASIVTVSLDEHDARDNDDESVALADNAPDPNAVDPADEAARRDAIVGLIHEIGRLGERPKMVLALYYQDEMTFKEIGQVLGVTESRVCQIHTEAILALRTRLVDPDVAARLGRRRARA